jgi:hypothetical protein
LPAQQFGGREAVHPRHANVHQHDVWRMFSNGRGHLVAIGCLAYEQYLVTAGKHHGERRTNHGVVVHDQHSDRPRYRRSGRRRCVDARMVAHAGHGSQAPSRKSPLSVRP